jgi:hypothetical protein
VRRWLLVALAVALIAILYGLRPRPAPKSPTPAVVESPVEFLSPLQPLPKTARDVPESERPRSACYQSYSSFYRGDSIDIRIAFGYKDARPARFVGDRYERQMFTAYLLAPCVAGWAACGFTREASDPDLFLKVIEGPDGKPKRVRVRVTHSSAGPDDEDNRANPLQNRQSELSRRNFVEGLREANAVFYNGHSRDGGGPDFDPPRLSKDRHVDYDWYLAHRPGEKLVVAELAGAKAELLGLFSCLSREHFLEKIREKKRGMATITSPQLLFYSDALKSQLGALSALLGQWCEAGFGSALRTGSEAGRSRLTDFFKPPR